MEKNKIPDPSTPEGREYRRNKIGSSDAAVILGVSPWKTPRQLYDEKIGLREASYTSTAMQRGIDMEPIARLQLEDLLGIPLMPEARLHPERNWQISSLDAWNEEKKVAAEIKVPGREDHEKALDGKVPDKYVPQLQHHMAVWDLPSILYFSWHEKDFASILVRRDEDYINYLLLEEKRFWDRLQVGEPPEIEKDNYVDISDNKDCKYWLDIYDSMTAKIKDMEQMAEEAKSKITAIVGDRNCVCNEFKIAKRERRGNIIYKNIPELKSLNLEPYRSAPVIYWQINKGRS
jgi:putative phage-type endonuclease